jgi:4-amino-4-deoxy-L-arabinose transferase-like glycosyltransferase
MLATSAALALALTARLPLADNTESRYGTIAWQMSRSGDWVTPRIYTAGQLQPFLGKPPLHFWLTALSYRVFGVSEWSARLPNFLLSVAIVAMTAAFAARLRAREEMGTGTSPDTVSSIDSLHGSEPVPISSRAFRGRRAAALAAVILASSALFFVLAGTCILDVPLTFGLTGAMIAFARFADGSPHRAAWGRLFFLGLAFGALAKGPIVLVLAGMALGLWIGLQGRWRLALELPWRSGAALFCVVVLPWYILAERASPGFLWYFIVHEHILRYFKSEYGDLYGHGRKQPYGAVWLMLLAALLPWTVLVGASLARQFRSRKILTALRGDPWLAYAILWGLTPAVFFTFARQLLPTYLLPGLPGLAIAAAVSLDRWIESDAEPALLRWLRWHLGALLPLAAVGSAAAVVIGAPWAAVAILAAAVCLLAWRAARNLRPGGSAAVLVLFGLTTTVAFGGAAMLLGPRIIDDRFSAKTILAQLATTPAADRPIVAPLEDVQSAIFYTEALGQGRFEPCVPHKVESIGELLDAPGNAVFLVKRKDWERVEPAVASRFTVMAETERWVALGPAN